MDIAAGPDESVWFSEQHPDRIGRVLAVRRAGGVCFDDNGKFPARDRGRSRWEPVVHGAGREDRPHHDAGVTRSTRSRQASASRSRSWLASYLNLWFTEYYNRIGRHHLWPGSLRSFLFRPRRARRASSPRDRTPTSGPPNRSEPDRADHLPLQRSAKSPFSRAGGTVRDSPSGPDGNLWFTKPNVNRIGSINDLWKSSGKSRSRRAGAGPSAIAAGRDWKPRSRKAMRTRRPGSCWTAWSRSLPRPLPRAIPDGIVEGPDGNISSTENAADKAGAILSLRPGSPSMSAPRRFPQPLSASPVILSRSATRVPTSSLRLRPIRRNEFELSGALGRRTGIPSFVAGRRVPVGLAGLEVVRTRTQPDFSAFLPCPR